MNDGPRLPRNFDSFSLVNEARALWDLSVPTIIIYLGFVVPSVLAASTIGRKFGHLELDGFSLASLSANVFQGTLLQGLFNASDTLSPQAFGAGNYREVGLLAIRGFVSSMAIIVPVNLVLFLYMDDILILLGQDAQASRYGWYFYMLYATGFPFYCLFTIIWKFLSAQNILLPLVISTLVSTCIVLPVAMEVCVDQLGFMGAALAIAIFCMFQSLSVLIWIAFRKPHNPETWPGLSAWKEAIAWGPFRNFLSLGIGGMLSYLEWIYFEALSLMCGKIGVLSLSAHTIPTQVIDLAFMFPLGLGVALSIRMGHTISQSVPQTKLQAIGTMMFSVIVFGIGSILMYIYQDAIIGIFTTETAVENLCQSIWIHVCSYFFVLGVYGIVIGISLGLGMQWTLGVVTVVALWLFGLPAAYYFAMIRGGGLVAVWTCLWPPYVLINGWMCMEFLTRDWTSISKAIRLREGLDEKDATHTKIKAAASALLDEDGDRNAPDYGTI